MSKSQQLTPDEVTRVPFPLTDLGFLPESTTYHGRFGDSLLFAQQPEGPWILEDGTNIPPDVFVRNVPNSTYISQIRAKDLTGTYNGKQVRFSVSRGEWIYQNNHPVTFPSPSPATPEPAGPSQLPTPQTAGTSLRTQVPQPTSPVPSPQRQNPAHIPQRQPLPQPRPAPRAVVPPPVNPAPPRMATPKLMGSPPEAFDGKAEKAESFLSQLDNYYYLNEAAFTNDSRRVSAALTHFKAGTTAGDWAQDRVTAAMTANPRTFGDWDDFTAAFRKHFIPAKSQLESHAMMHHYPQNATPFNEWYQQWYTYALRARVDEPTRIFAFRRNLNYSLHQKLLSITPQPDTLALLVEKAREFDRLHQMYNSPAFTQKIPTARIRSSKEENTQLYHPLTEEEKERYRKENRCFYCGKPNHSAKYCRTRLAHAQENQPTIRAAATLEDTEEDETIEGLKTSRLHTIPEYDLGIERPKSAPHDL